jgi:hypothetical protein
MHVVLQGGEVLGSGSSGVTCAGKWRGQLVAVKKVGPVGPWGPTLFTTL